MGGLLSLSSEYGFVLEDDEGICGYALGTVDVKPFVKKCKLSWIPFMQEKYSKPDCQKDLTEAEVSFCSGITCLREMNIIHILMFGLLFVILMLPPYFRILTLPVSSSLQKMMLSFHEEEEGLPDSFLSNFPSLIKVDIHANVTDPSVAKSMMGCLLSSLKANGGSQQRIDYDKFYFFFFS